MFRTTGYKQNGGNCYCCTTVHDQIKALEIIIKKAVDTLMNKSPEKPLEVAEQAARKAGKVVLGLQGHALISEKGTNNLVTDADLASQEAIIKIIESNYPDHSIIAEEQDLKVKKGAAEQWIIDPLDGTNNFAHNIPHLCISVAYACSGLVEAGVVYDPVRDELFTARRGKGAFMNGIPISVSEAQSLAEAVVATGFYYDRGRIMRKTLKSIEQLFEANVHGIRRLGSAALDLCWVACGRFDAYFEYTLSVWDFAAGMLILKEAEGLLTDQEGKKLDLNSTGITVSNGNFHNEFISVVGWDKVS